MSEFPPICDPSGVATVGPSSKHGSKPGERRGGRVKGTPNKLTQSVKQVIGQVAADLGGAKRMLAWAQAEPGNERLFWSQMYLKLVPKEVKAEHSGEISTASPVLVVPATLTPQAWSEAVAAYQVNRAAPATSKDEVNSRTVHE